MYKNFSRFFILLAIASLSTSVFAKETLYIQSSKAKLYDEPSFNANYSQYLSKGIAVKVMESSGSWIKVQAAQNEGWISKLLAAPKPPLDQTSVLKNSYLRPKESARRRASDTSEVAAARGLRSEERKRSSDQSKTDYKALQKMENMSKRIEIRELSEFQKDIRK